MNDFINSIKENVQQFEKPFRHWGLEGPLNLTTIDEIMSVRIPDGQRVYDGTRAADYSGDGVDGKLRIFVNKEISELICGLINAFNILPIGGVIVVVSFHSIEDKIVKFFFKNYSQSKNLSRYLPEQTKEKKLFKLINNKAIFPSDKEKK